ncbi:MAG: heme exporter protein CcmD [Alphaproteobacteria bacterium]|nr:MAG: heme exporter protein CcmD [Alphaproteobacteria bacterium]
MRDYTFYIAAAWMLTAVVLGALVLQSFLRARAAERDAPPDA